MTATHFALRLVEPKPGTFHRPAHGFGIQRIREAAEMRLSGPMTAELLAATPKPDRRRALELLAASRRGCTETLLLAHGVTVEQMVGLIRAGLATAAPERVVTGRRSDEITRVKITDAGRRAFSGASS
jgi:hypothetical protein